MSRKNGRNVSALRRSCLVLLLALAPAALGQTDRGATVRIKALDSRSEVGRQKLVLIAINRYQSWPGLQGPVRDAEELRRVLEERYCIDDVVTLYDEKATGAAIRKLLVKLQSEAKEEDSVLIFYAGHGHLQKESNSGFWIPVDGGRDEFEQSNWIPNSQIRGTIAGMRAKRVLVVADACFSGDLLNVHRGRPPEITNDYFRRAFSLRSRQVLTSGASESVPDQSEFARQLIRALRENQSSYVDPVMLYEQVRLGVRTTLPLVGNLQSADHQDGASFLLFLKGGAATPAAGPAPATVPAIGSADAEKLALASWEGIKESRDPADFRQFLADFPASKLRGVAESTLRRLTQAAAPAVVGATATPGQAPSDGALREGVARSALAGSAQRPPNKAHPGASAARSETRLVGVSYPYGKTVHLPFHRTEIAPRTAVLAGTVKYSGEDSVVSIRWERMEPAVLFAGNISAYSVWAVPREGQPENLGELGVREKKEGAGQFRTAKGSFALVVTAEIMAGALLPGELVVFTSGRVDEKTTASNWDFTYAMALPFAELYRPGNPSVSELSYKAGPGVEPIELQQARNAVEFAGQIEAAAVAPREMEGAAAELERARNAARYGGSRVAVVDYSRRALEFATVASRLRLKQLLYEQVATTEAGSKPPRVAK